MKFFLVLIFLFSCNTEDVFLPAGCNTSKPNKGTINIKVTIDALNPSVAIALYEGDVDTGILIKKDTLRNGSKEYRLENEEYSAKATYKKMINGKTETVISINAADLNYKTEEYKDGNCYSEGYEDIDITL